jgi:hypothetical protein
MLLYYINLPFLSRDEMLKPHKPANRSSLSVTVSHKLPDFVTKIKKWCLKNENETLKLETKLSLPPNPKKQHPCTGVH